MSDAPSLLKRIDNTHVPMLLARVILAFVFIKFGLHKIGTPIEFLKVVREYQLLPLDPPQLMNMTAVALPWVEIVCGALLLAGFWVRGASASILAMLFVFTTAIFLRTMRVYGEGGQAFCDIKFDCGCGGGEIIICTKLAENLSLVGLSLVALLSRSRKFAVESLPVKPAPQ